MATTYGSNAYCASILPILRCAPRDNPAASALTAKSQALTVLVHLIRCHRPSGALEPAPSTSLREPAEGEQWAGFWCLTDDRYYARCSSTAGERWFLIADGADDLAPGRRRRARSNVVAFPRTATSPRMIVGRYRGQAMIVGTRRRREPTGGTR